MDNSSNIQIKKIAMLVSCASVLQIVESMFPHPIPGVRLGFSNIITLIALVDMGFGPALEIAVIRAIISSYVLGTFLSPSFFLSFFGALTSTLVMGACYKVVLKLKTKFLSLTGISLLGAVTHNLTQIIFVYFFLINQKEIFYLLPWLGLSAVIMGWINGLIASRVCKNLADNIGIEATLKEEIANSNSFKYKSYIGGDSFIHDLKPEIKIVIAFFAGICILFTGNIYLYLFLLFFLFAGYVIAELSLVDYIKEISKMWLFLAASFLLPVFFNFTQDGLSAGTRFVLRIILLMSISSLLIKTTAPEKLAAGFKNILSPFQRLGISAHCAQRVGAIIALSWKSMPAVWDKINNLIHSQKVSLKRFPEIIQGLSTVIFLVYKESEK